MKPRLTPLVLLALVPAVAAAQALVTERTLSANAAQEAARVALEACRKEGHRVTVTVLDHAGRETRVLRPVGGNGSSRGGDIQVHLVIPKSFNDAQQIADQFKDAVPVILNLQSTDTDLSKRLIDFSSGLTYALDGGMQRIADKVFLLTPRNVDVSAEERARLIEKGFFNQS